MTSRDNFRDNGACVEGDITRATSPGWHYCGLGVCIDSRWHTRCVVHSQPSAYGYWASCTPHWDWPACFKHEVPPIYNGTENYSGSGFDAGRDWLWWQLIQESGMTFVGPVSFNNTAPHTQCNGDVTIANGRVNVILLQ